MTELFPTLHKMSGGKKQSWINNNLDFVMLLHDNIGFEKTCQVLHMKADTLNKALIKAERSDRRSITRADRAYSLAAQADNRSFQCFRELAIQAEAIAATDGEVQELKQNLTSYFTLMSETNKIMAKLCQAKCINFTEYVDKHPERKVGPTTRSSRGRLLVCHPGRCQLPGKLSKSPRHRHHFARRRPDV